VCILRQNNGTYLGLFQDYVSGICFQLKHFSLCLRFVNLWVKCPNETNTQSWLNISPICEYRPNMLALSVLYHAFYVPLMPFLC